MEVLSDEDLAVGRERSQQPARDGERPGCADRLRKSGQKVVPVHRLIIDNVVCLASFAAFECCPTIGEASRPQAD